MRQRYVIGNWKMNGAMASNAALLYALRAHPALAEDATHLFAVCPPFPYLSQVENALRGSSIEIGAQDVSDQPSGAFTGQVSAEMLKEFGCTYALVGHSERRHGLGESSARVAEKAAQALRAGITPVVCVGELQAERDRGDATAVVIAQLQAVVDRLQADTEKVIVAYEPVWAIGTGRTATPADAQTMHAQMRSFLAQRNAGDVSILYGGSVKADNAATLFAQPDIDGGLIGGAALDASAFAAICSALKQRG